MRHQVSRATASLLLLIILASGPLALADPAGDYEAARAKSRDLAESLQAYSIVSRLVMENNVKGQTDGMKLEATQTAHGRMPDRLFLSLDSSMVNQQIGTGPQESWFLISNAKACYVGEPVTLTRTLDRDEEAGLSEDAIYNFYSGLINFLFLEDRTPLGEVVQEDLTIDGKPVPCQVFSFATENGTSRFWFDPAVGLILKARLVTEISDRGVAMERTLTTTVQSYDLDPQLSDDSFRFSAPEGLPVVDSLDRVMNPDSMVGQPAPDITFTRLDGSKLELKELRGKVVFIDFWATWCGPCKMEMPHIETLYQEFKDDPGIVFIGASNEGQGVVEGFLKKNDYNFPIVLVDNLERSKYKVTGIPAGFVIDPEGMIRAHMVGVQNESQLRAAFRKAGFGD